MILEMQDITSHFHKHKHIQQGTIKIKNQMKLFKQKALDTKLKQIDRMIHTELK